MTIIINYFLIIFLIQSSYSIERIDSSINEFLKFLKNDLKINHENYVEKFRLLKESMLIDYKKNFSDLSEELSSYIETIVTKNFIFDLNSLYYDVCFQLEFTKDIEPYIKKIIKSKSLYYNVILDKNH